MNIFGASINRNNRNIGPSGFAIISLIELASNSAEDELECK